jgi:acetyltransferase-like isoleucine patch superfamily enzyme
MVGRILNRVFTRFTTPVPIGLFLVNFLFQRILGFNAVYRFPVHFTSTVTGDVSIGEGVWSSFAISGGCYIQGANGLVIEDGTIFAPGVKILSANHSIGGLKGWDQAEPIRIGKECWLGANSVILPGVVLGDRVVVGAGAVVTKSFPSNSIVGGVPAKLMRTVESPANENKA